MFKDIILSTITFLLDVNEREMNAAIVENEADGMRMILGTNGLKIENRDTSVVLILDPTEKCLEIRSDDEVDKNKTINLKVDGNIIYNKNENLFEKFENLKNENVVLKKQLEELTLKLEQVYYAPGMPGYVECFEDFDDGINSTFQINKDYNDISDDHELYVERMLSHYEKKMKKLIYDSRFERS